LIRRLGSAVPPGLRTALAIASAVTLGAAARPAVAYNVTLNLSAPATAIVGQPMIIQVSGVDDYPYGLWVTSVTIPASVLSSCPSAYLDATQVAAHVGGEILSIASPVVPDPAGNYSNPIGYTPKAPGKVLICVYDGDGYTNTFASASMTLDVQPATSTPTTPGATTTTMPPFCRGGGCEIDAAVHGAACARDTVPRSVTRKIDQAVKLVEQAETTQSQKATRLRKKARALLSLAAKAAVKASRGRKAKLSPACATALQGAAETVLSGLPR
jgi:hypothetical protein